MNVLFKILLGVVVLAPLPFGSVPMVAWSMIAVAVAGLMGAWVLITWRSGQPPAVPLARIWPSAVLFGLVIIWAMLQTATWTPVSWHHPLWKAASEALGEQLASSVSLYRFESWSVISRLLMYAAVFWLALQLCRDRDRARLALKVISLAGAIYAAYAVAVLLSGTNLVLWIERPQHPDVASGTYIARGNFAAFAGLCFLAATAVLIGAVENNLPRDLKGRELSRRLLTFLLQRQWPILTACILLAGSVILSQSRAGGGATLLAFCAFLFLLSARRVGRRKLALYCGAAMVVGMVALTAFAGGKVMDRIGSSDGGLDERQYIYETTLRAVADSPLLGTGLGSFTGVYQLYSRGEILALVNRAHNIYLSNALELGIPATVLLNLSVVILVFICVIGVRRRERDTLYPILGVCASILVGAQSMLDFPLENASIAVLFFFLLGAGCAQSWSSRRD